MKHYLSFLVYLILTSCSLSTTGENVKKNSTEPVKQTNDSILSIKKSNARSSLTTKLKEIDKLIDLNCDNSSQCKVLGVGFSSCGGFSSYNIYSNKKSDVNGLKSKVEQYNRLMKIQIQKNSLVGICRHIEPPKTTCQIGRCSTLRNSMAL